MLSIEQAISVNDLLGDLHVHTAQDAEKIGSWDATITLDEIANWIRTVNDKVKYFVVAEHAEGIAGALWDKEYDPEKTYANEGFFDLQRARIDRFNKENPDIKVLCGLEATITQDGRISVTDETLRKADLVIASVHFNRNSPAIDLTERALSGLRHPNVDILGHMGRSADEWKDINWELIGDEAAKRDRAIEINLSNLIDDDTRGKSMEPGRHLEVLERLSKTGVRISIGSDIHSSSMIKTMRDLTLGEKVVIARLIKDLNGLGFTKDRVLNTYTADDLLAWAKNNDRL